MDRGVKQCLGVGVFTSELLSVAIVNGEYRVEAHQSRAEAGEAAKSTWSLAESDEWFSQYKDQIEKSAPPGFCLYAPKGVDKPVGKIFKWELEVKLEATADGANIGSCTTSPKYPILARSISQKVEQDVDGTTTIDTWKIDVDTLAAILCLSTLSIKIKLEDDPHGLDRVFTHEDQAFLFRHLFSRGVSIFNIGGAFSEIQREFAALRNTAVDNRPTRLCELLPRLCAQNIFRAFMYQLVSTITHISGSPSRHSPLQWDDKTTLRWEHPGLSKLTDIVRDSKLALDEKDAYMLVIPTFQAYGLLPTGA